MVSKVSTLNTDGVGAVLAAAEDGSVKLATGVPGYPINGIFASLQSSGSICANWQYNEKIAYEMAVGSSACGERAIVVSKHVGINVMSDPLIISATHGIGAGIVVIAGDDVGAELSQNEQDSRWYGKLAEIPVYDPSTPQDLYDSIFDGLALSERISAPVLVRVTVAVLNDRSDITRRKYTAEPGKLGRDIWNYTMYGKHQKYLKEGWSAASFESSRSGLNKIVRRGPYGIISSGHASIPAAAIAASYRMSHLTLGFVNPFPKNKVNDFISEMEYVLVCEDVAPFLEEHINSPKARGRMTGHLPRAGVLDEDNIMNAVENILKDRINPEIVPETLESRGFAKSLCKECPYKPVYDAIKMLDAPVSSDVGCSIYTANPPYNIVTVACGLGSSISAACGFNKKGVAMAGDFSLLHTGLQSMLNAKLHGHNVLVVVFVNEEAAMTGGQKIPEVTGIIKSLFGDDCSVNEAEGLTAENVYEDLKKMYEEPSMKVYLVKGLCVKK
ncbi:indolepyruvate oxidoreductase [Methanocella sp. CWC-04]|uniref:Indolepyruvate oxidoreductase subunit IorA n=1 Tax=Methanooceanicella nereidis TaxID=2052831 RepID=A0AAP2W7X5_9EURY|nr:thiamine pyrophosphate-dependent enzyme [Methanocella sp. CWC-04]MCD1295694.1 indolepyruvate oxidoreductase [Methanocella sp. CWC-04]